MVLSPQEVAQYFEHVPSLKYRAALMLCYGVGLRITEAVSLKVRDIDSKRMLLRVEQGKGKKDRYAMLSPRLLAVLRCYYRALRPNAESWLFPSWRTKHHLGSESVSQACRDAAKQSGRNRHCPKCQSLARAQWLESRQADCWFPVYRLKFASQTLPVEYFHVVFTLPEQIAELAFYNQDVLYGFPVYRLELASQACILFRAASETLLTLGADPKHLGAQLGFFAILHTWGQNLLLNPHS